MYEGAQIHDTAFRVRELIDYKRYEVVLHKLRQQRSKRNKKYSDLFKRDFERVRRCADTCFWSTPKDLSPRPAARKAQDKRLLASYPPPGRTFDSVYSISIWVGGRTRRAAAFDWAKGT